MTQVQKQASKQKPAKQASAKPAKQASANPYAYASILADALAGKFGGFIQRFYVSAIAYHTKQQTTFPRGRILAVQLLAPADARAFIEKHAQTSIPPGSHTGQKIFDHMMIEAREQASKQASK